MAAARIQLLGALVSAREELVVGQAGGTAGGGRREEGVTRAFRGCCNIRYGWEYTAVHSQWGTEHCCLSRLSRVVRL